MIANFRVQRIDVHAFWVLAGQRCAFVSCLCAGPAGPPERNAAREIRVTIRAIEESWREIVGKRVPEAILDESDDEEKHVLSP